MPSSDGVQNVALQSSFPMLSDVIIIAPFNVYNLTWKMIFVSQIATAWLNSEERNGSHQVSKRVIPES